MAQPVQARVWGFRWHSGKPNYGLVITTMGALRSSTPESAYGFYSREHEDKTKPPVLIIKSAGGGNAASTSAQAPANIAAKKAYQEYITAYNRMTSLMAKRKGDTPEAQEAYKAFQQAKAKYEASIKDAGPPESD